MKMFNTDEVAVRLRNDKCEPDVGPLAHLILSGHTHNAWPVGDLPTTVSGIKQDQLGDYQLQLIGDAMLLNTPLVSNQNKRGVFAGKLDTFSTRNRGRCAAQVLRFYYD